MTNAQVFAAFASRNRSVKRAESNSVRSVRVSGGVVLYSYATPIAFFADDHEIPSFTLRKFSVTTSKQQSQARREFATTRNLSAENFVREATKVGASFTFAR